VEGLDLAVELEVVDEAVAVAAVELEASEAGTRRAAAAALVGGGRRGEGQYTGGL